MQRTSFTLASREYFEPLAQYAASPRYRLVLESLLPPDWTIDRSGPWVRAGSGRQVPVQGFKIHVSAIAPHAEAILRAVVPECVRRRMTFKIAADERLLTLMNSKRYSRGGSGKFMTLYPADLDEFKSTLAALHDATRNLPVAGPYILSDRRYADSKILSYRFGGFLERRRLNVDGTGVSLLVAPDGERMVDSREPYFELPAWVDDPFPEESASADDASTIINGRYRVDGAFAVSNVGGVYRALDLQTGQDVVIKEARQLTEYHELPGGTVDAQVFLRREWDVLNRLAATGLAPKPIEYFREWEHEFLVEELIGGQTFWKYWAERSRLLFPYVRRPGRIAEFLPRFRALGLAFLDAIEVVHAHGVFLGDISTRNVFVSEEDGVTVRFIDVESASLDSDADDSPFTSYSKNNYTYGFNRPGRDVATRLTRADDYYAIGSLLFAAIIPVQEFFGLAPHAAERVLREVERVGLPLASVRAIRALHTGDVRAARAELEQLPTETLT